MIDAHGSLEVADPRPCDPLNESFPNAAEIGREIEFLTVNAGFWALVKRRVDKTSDALIS
jgi:hypothetical protein